MAKKIQHTITVSVAPQGRDLCYLLAREGFKIDTYDIYRKDIINVTEKFQNDGKIVPIKDRPFEAPFRYDCYYQGTKDILETFVPSLGRTLKMEIELLGSADDSIIVSPLNHRTEFISTT